jgi:glycosyltransferase involved in cell wall biosynthesis
MHPKFTIIVPTVNRPETLLHTLRTLVDQPGDDYEILVSDDQGPAENLAVVEQFKSCNKIRYLRTEQRLGMRGNYEFSVSHATGDYVTILGDDDGFVPNGMNVVRGILRQVDSEPEVLFWWPHMYWWPTALVPVKRNMLYINSNPKNAAFVNPRDFVEELFNNDRNYWKFERLPSIYNGFVHRNLLDRLYQRTGKFFSDEIPDVYSGIANGVLAQSGILIERAISVRGISGKSFGVAFRNKNEGAILRQEMKSAMLTPMCEPDLVDSTALAVHIASIRLRAIRLFSELSQYKIHIPDVIHGILSELPEDPDRYEDLVGDASALAQKYGIEFTPPEKSTVLYQAFVKKWGVSVNQNNGTCLLAINCEYNGVKNIDDACRLVWSILGD